MQMDATEKAKLDDEWKRMAGTGRALSRKRMIASLAAVAVATPFFVASAIAFFFIHWRGAFLFIPGIILGAIVQKKLWPKGQFA